MSVINQMLKDLEKRDNEQNVTQSSHLPIMQPQSSRKLLWTILAVLVVINIIGLTIWQLYSENKSLKTNIENKPLAMSHQPENVKQPEHVTPPINQQENTQQPTNVQQLDNISQSTIIDVEKHVQAQTTSTQKVINSEQVNSQLVENDNALVSRSSSVQANKTAANEKENLLLNSAKASVLSEKESPEPSSFSISRRQLTSSELIARKINLAEKALAINDSKKAEELYEDILLIQPEHKLARKKLAALWFGRQEYQAAVNLLSQGIALDSRDSEFRLMKARIYLTTKNNNAALATLKGYSDSNDQEYQALLAHVAQQVEDYPAAINAYKVLIEQSPQSGKWWLGLAIAFDSEGLFEEATQSYKVALEKDDLSKSSADFIDSRLRELGE